MIHRNIKLLCIGLMILAFASSAIAQETGTKTRREDRQDRRQDRRGDRDGVVAGAAFGLALGVVSGEPGMAAAGAAMGATAGAMYEYDQSKEDRRTKMLADSIGGAQKGETADDAGKRHLTDFLGDWNLSIWAMNAEGNKVTATGKAKIVMQSKEVLQIEYTDIESPGYDQKVTGSSVLNYSSSSGFMIENKFSNLSDVRKYVGEFVPEKNTYNFYPTNNKEETGVMGVIRSNVRIELRVSGTNLAVAETYTMLEGNEVQVQSYRFTKQ